MPGPNWPITTGSGTDDTLSLVTTTFTAPLTPGGSTSNGICALIWPGETKFNGAATPLIVTDVPFRLVESGTVWASAMPAANWLPKIEISPPGETGLPFSNVAAL